LRDHEVVSTSIIFASGVLTAIKFDNQLVFAAGEIGKVRTDWKLSSELCTANLSAFQIGPQRVLSFVVSLA